MSELKIKYRQKNKDELVVYEVQNIFKFGRQPSILVV